MDNRSRSMLTRPNKGRRNIAVLIFNLSAGWGWVAIFTPRPFYPRGKSPLIAKEDR